MSRNTKILLGVVAGILVLICVCSCAGIFLFMQSAGRFLERSAVTDPGQVAAVASNITGYELPPGYSEQFAMNLFGFSVVAFTDQTEQMFIMLMQFPEFAGLDQAEMERQLREAVQGQAGTGDIQMETVEQTTVIIRDQEVPLTISEGTDADGRTVRQISGLFRGRGGPTLLMIFGPIQNWDQAAVESFLASLE